MIWKWNLSPIDRSYLQNLSLSAD